jgi:hypothetical protein
VRIANASAVAASSATAGYGDLLPVLRLLAPGSAPADVRVTVTGSSGSGHKVLSLRVEGGKVTDLTLPGLTDGVYSLDVESTRPVVAGARVATVTDPSGSTTATATGTAAGTTTNPTGTDGSVPGGTSTGTDAGLLGVPGATNAGGGMNAAATTATARGVDLAWIAAADPLGAAAPLAVADGPGATLSLANPTGRTVSVKVAGIGGGTVQVPAGGTAITTVHAGVGTLTGGSGLRAAVSFAGSAAVAAYPVAPADQAAHPVRVTH